MGQPEFQLRPLSRVGELVEVVPGALATQHSGLGKANQYFLRGFNLDHGTDFSVSVDGVPMNMPTHAHGQGYLDLNSIIPELVDTVEYGKGPYYADIAYYYKACLKSEGCPRGGEDPGIPGILKHPVEPRRVRVTASLRF